MKFKDIKYLVMQSAKEWQEDKATRLASSLAYYTIFSIPPLLILTLAIVGQFYDRSAAQSELINQIDGFVGRSGAEAIGQILENASQPTGSAIATIVGLITLLFGASGVFGQLQDAMNTIWDVTVDPEAGIMMTIRKRFFSFTMVVGIGFLLLVSLILSWLLAQFTTYLEYLLPGSIVLAQVLEWGISFGVIMGLFAFIYKVVPDVIVEWRDVWIGAGATAVLFTIGEYLLTFYLDNYAPTSSYGAAGSLIVLLLWVYYSAQILFFGAEFTQVYANRYGSRIRPDDHAILLNPEERINQGIPRREAVAQAKAAQQEQGAAGGNRSLSPWEPPITVRREPLVDVPQGTKTAVRHYYEAVVTALSFAVGAWRAARSWLFRRQPTH